MLNYLEIEVHFISPEFNHNTFLTLSNINQNNKKYEYVNLSNLSSLSLEYVKNFLAEYDLLIGYELAHTTKEIFDALEIKYIDVWISSIRFCSDLLFEFYSNDPEINKKFTNYKLNKAFLFQRAQAIKDQTFSFKNPNLQLVRNSALLIGQVFEDLAVMKDGKFLTLIDYHETVAEIAPHYNKLYLLKHPLMKLEDYEKVSSMFQNIPNFEYLPQINVYKLLASDEIEAVYGISSSVLTEAYYFNKKVTFFYKPVIDSRYTCIKTAFYRTSFWKDILSLECRKKDIEFLADDGYLRYKLNSIYSYKDFNDVQEMKYLTSLHYGNLRNVWLFISSLSSNKNYILYGYEEIGQFIMPHIPNLIGVINKGNNLHLVDKKISIIPINELINYPDAYLIVTRDFDEETIKNLEKYTTRLIFFK